MLKSEGSHPVAAMQVTRPVRQPQWIGASLCRTEFSSAILQRNQTLRQMFRCGWFIGITICWGSEGSRIGQRAEVKGHTFSTEEVSRAETVLHCCPMEAKRLGLIFTGCGLLEEGMGIAWGRGWEVGLRHSIRWLSLVGGNSHTMT